MTQYERILKYLDDYGSISPLEAFRDSGITKLATRISEMTSRFGLMFDRERETSKNRYNESVSYMRYRRAA